MALGIAEFGQPSVALLGRRLGETLKALGDELGIQIELEPRSIRYSKESVIFKGEARIVTPEGQISREQRDFEQVCSSFGLTAADYKMPFGWNGKQWLLVGFNLQAVKYPYSAINRHNGKVFRLPESALAGTKVKPTWVSP